MSALVTSDTLRAAELARSPACDTRRVQAPPQEPLVSERLVLDPLVPAHAAEMVDVLADESLYEFTGGEPPSLQQLTRRYAAQVVGHSDDGLQTWFNWIVKLRDTGSAVGFVQATVDVDDDGATADVAWVINSSHQGQGIASEATQMMITWLRSMGVRRFTALIHPDHEASMGVARHQGFRRSDAVCDGEIRWDWNEVTPDDQAGRQALVAGGDRT